MITNNPNKPSGPAAQVCIAENITGLCPEPCRSDRYPINGAPLRSSLAPDGALYLHAEVARVFTASPVDSRPEQQGFSPLDGYGFGQRISCLRCFGRMAVMILCLLLSSCQEEQKPLSPFADRVLEYMPAPGQFINSEPLASAEEACAYAQRMLDAGSPLSLGGFGGYIVVGFDHSIEATAGWNLEIRGNAYTNNSEPGVVWVMEDSNANGLPDDVWYELKGSEYGLEGTRQAYSVTYYRPEAPCSDVRWTDNSGNEGVVAYQPAFHNQDYYYPAWLKEDSYTLTGTCLEARNEDVNGDGSLWLNKDYAWGYADNFSNEDMLSGWTCFRFSNAVDEYGKPAKLGRVDFVKVQCAVNASSGWTGEISTEVSGIADFNLISKFQSGIIPQ